MPPSDTTGRYLVLFAQDKAEAASRRLEQLAHARIVHSTDAKLWSAGEDDDVDAQAEDENCAWVFDHIGVALLRCRPSAAPSLTTASADDDGVILAIEPERRVRAFEGATEGSVAWGVHAVGADLSPYTGKGVRIAILDTGLDLSHPDFKGRAVTAVSFIPGEPVQDANGHGTHCAGIAAGPRDPEGVGRYGVAGDAELFIGKVLSDSGGGADGNVLEGIDWAIRNGCHIVSLSLGSAAQPEDSYSQVFETVARRALEAGTLIIAAAGNESRRPDHIAPVGHPANCPSILAVAAIDAAMDIAPFSCGGLQGQGGEVNVAAPGVDVPSSWPMPERYRAISGTSMATPFVAGVAALYAEADPDARGARLGERLARDARQLSLPPRDVGAGLVQAPAGTGDPPRSGS